MLVIVPHDATRLIERQRRFGFTGRQLPSVREAQACRVRQAFSIGSPGKRPLATKRSFKNGTPREGESAEDGASERRTCQGRSNPESGEDSGD